MTLCPEGIRNIVKIEKRLCGVGACPADLVPVAVDKINIRPIRRGALTSEAVSIDGSMESPRMVREGIIFVNDLNESLVVGNGRRQNFVVQHAAVRTLKIVKVDYFNFGRWCSADRPSIRIDCQEWVVIEIELLKPCKSRAISGNQKFDRRTFIVIYEGHWQGVIAPNVALDSGPQLDVVLRGH